MFLTLTWRKISISLVMFAVVAFGSVAIARADAVQFPFNNGSTLPDQNYGTLDLVLNVDNSITFTINLTASGARIIQTGQEVSIGFNSSLAPNPTIAVSGLPANYFLISTTANGCPGAGGDECHADGFGDYEYGIGSNYDANDLAAATVLSFTVTRTGGFASVFDLVENSTGGGIASPFAIDIFCPGCNNGQGATGFIGTGTPTNPVPEPASMLLLGTGLVGVATTVRRRLKARK